MPPKRKPTISATPAASAPTKKVKKPDSSSDSDSSSSDEDVVSLVDKKTGKKIVWEWAGDSKKGSQDVWEAYARVTALKLEKAWQESKDKKKKPRDIKIDKERFVDFEEMMQKRYDDPSKRRLVRRTLAGKDDSSSSEDSSDEDDKKKKNVKKTTSISTATVKKAPSSGSLKKAASTASTSSSKKKAADEDEEDEEDDVISTDEEDSDDDDDDSYPKWYWAGDSNGGPAKGGGHQDVWVEFEKKLCLKFEKALNRMKKRVKVDKERFVDLQNMLQRRYDDKMKRRSLKREDAKNPKKPKKKKVTKSASLKKSDSTSGKKSSKAKGKKEESSEDESSEDEDDKKKKQKKPQKSSSTGAADLLKPPPYWETPDSMDYKEYPVPSGTAEWNWINGLVVNTIAPYHKNQSSVTFNTFTMTKITRVQNPVLWLRYRARKDAIVGQCNGKIVPIPNVLSQPSTDAAANEFFLFHGLNSSFITGITKFGFDPRFCSLTGMFGAGLYFAENSSKSNQYVHSGACTVSGPNAPGCKCKKSDEVSMLLCRVTLGDALIEQNFRGNAPGQFWHGRRTEPNKPDGKSIYHSVVGEAKNNYAAAALLLREYIVYESGQVYPEYIVYYKRT